MAEEIQKSSKNLIKVNNFIKDKKSLIMKFIFPLEFILSLLITYVMLRFVIIKNYSGYNSLKHIIMMGIFGLAILAIIIYNCKNNKGKIEKIVIGFLIPIGMMYLVFMLPSQVPDEQAHLRRAYEVSEGVLIGRKDTISVIPRDLQTKIKPNLESYRQFSESLAGSTDYNDKIEINNPAGTYPFILYIFSAIGFVIARIFDLNILIGCYLAKLMNFIVFLFAAYYTLKIIPFGKYVMTAVMFMPMFLHQATSTSADCLINIICMVFIAYLLYLYFKKEKIKKREGVLLVVLGVLMSIVKYVYLPIIGLSFIFIFSKNMSKKYKIILISSLVILSIIAALGYYIFSSSYGTAFTKYYETNNVNTSEQIKGMISNPKGFLDTLNYTFKNMGETYIYQMVGIALGWLCIYPNRIWITIYIIAMLASCFIEKNKVAFNWKQKIWGCLISVVIILLIVTGMYITWTKVGNIIVDGVQGRYFIPVAFILLLCLCKKENYIKIKNIEYKFPILLCLLNLPILNTIYHFFI